MFAARDKDGTLKIFFTEEPERVIGKDYGYWTVLVEDEENDQRGYEDPGYEIDKNLFPELTWESEPIEVFLNTGFDMASQVNHVWAMLKCTQDELAKERELRVLLQSKLDNIESIIKQGRL